MASAPDSDTRVIPTCVGKLGIDSFVAFVISGHPHLCGEIRVVVLMVAPAWRGFGGCSRTTPNPRNRTGGDPVRVPPSPETLMSIIHELPGREPVRSQRRRRCFLPCPATAGAGKRGHVDAALSDR